MIGFPNLFSSFHTQEVHTMNAAMTIEEFNAFLKSEQSDNALLEMLRRLTKIEKPEDVRAIQRIVTQANWQGWAL